MEGWKSGRVEEPQRTSASFILPVCDVRKRDVRRRKVIKFIELAFFRKLWFFWKFNLTKTLLGCILKIVNFQSKREFFTCWWWRYLTSDSTFPLWVTQGVTADEPTTQCKHFNLHAINRDSRHFGSCFLLSVRWRIVVSYEVTKCPPPTSQTISIFITLPVCLPAKHRTIHTHSHTNQRTLSARYTAWLHRGCFTFLPFRSTIHTLEPPSPISTFHTSNVVPNLSIRKRKDWKRRWLTYRKVPRAWRLTRISNRTHWEFQARDMLSPLPQRSVCGSLLGNVARRRNARIRASSVVDKNTGDMLA